MSKKVKIMEACVITSDDKGELTLVGHAKEAITTLQKNKVEVTIQLEKTSKEDAEKFLKENNVPYAALLTAEEKPDGKYDACVIPDANTVLLTGDWEWTLSRLVDKLYDKSEKPLPKSDQQKMDDKFKDYKYWADQANESRKKRRSGGDNVVAG